MIIRCGMNAVGTAGLQYAAYTDEVGQPRLRKPLGRCGVVCLLFTHLNFSASVSFGNYATGILIVTGTLC